MKITIIQICTDMSYFIDEVREDGDDMNHFSFKELIRSKNQGDSDEKKYPTRKVLIILNEPVLHSIPEMNCYKAYARNLVFSHWRCSFIGKMSQHNIQSLKRWSDCSDYYFWCHFYVKVTYILTVAFCVIGGIWEHIPGRGGIYCPEELRSRLPGSVLHGPHTVSSISGKWH